MSIQQVQSKNILDFIAKAFFVNGINPTTEQLLSNISEFFAKYPTGLPVMPPINLFTSGVKSDNESMNDFMAFVIMNIDTLYEVCADQIDQILVLNTALRTHLDRLKIKRKVSEHRIDDYLMGIFNSDGYFYSFSDSFADTTYIDLNLSNAFIDTLATTASIPSVGSGSTMMDVSSLADPNVSIKDIDGNILSWNKKTDFVNAIDGMTNTAWYFEVITSSPTTVIATIDIPVSTSNATSLSRVDLIPHGVTPVRCGINAVYQKTDLTSYTASFSNQILTSADKMTFIGDQGQNKISRITIQASKTTADYTIKGANANSYAYMFGFKEILITEQVYDSVATLITEPISIPQELRDEASIDMVSLVTDDYIPTNTSIKYYVAEDIADANNISDFEWREVTPISNLDSNAAKSISFDGSYSISKMIRLTPRASNDIQMISLNTTSVDLAKRNPTSSYFPGLDVYRICEFSEQFLAGTLKLEEGVNTTRVYYTELSDDAIDDDFTFWKKRFDDKDYFLTYGEIDSGNGFFYGANVGENSKSIYAETFIETEAEFPVFLKECRKADVNSKLWNIRLFLNGREIAKMPVGVNTMTVPWKLKEGVNHIVLMANIPAATVSAPTPYLGVFNIMSDANLYDYGIVKLDNWTYVDPHKMQNNQVNQPNSFTIFNNEIVSRKQPTNNFNLRFKKDTSSAPIAIRLRADLGRSEQNPAVTPIIDSYRLRFAYR